MNKHFKLSVFPLLFGLILAVFSGAVSPAQTGEASKDPVGVDDLTVVAVGYLVPRKSVELSFLTAGQVAEILIKEGDMVKAGDVLARLGGVEKLEAAYSSVELELAVAKLEKALGEADLLAAQQELEAIYKNWPSQATLALQAFNAARERQYTAEWNLRYLKTTADQTDIDLAYTQFLLAKADLKKAKAAFDIYKNAPADHQTRASLQSKFAEAQKSYDVAASNYNALTEKANNDFFLSQAEAEFSIANAQLEQAQKIYDELLVGPASDDIALAQAKIAVAEKRIETAEQRILTGQANLANAKANFDNLDLVATIDGTVLTLDLIEGQLISPGVIVLTIADFSEWFVETDNLTEIDVVNVTNGMTATIIPDPLPDVTLTGVVDSISEVYEAKRGKITYTARILLNKEDPRLRWGMTVMLTLEE